MPVQYRALVVVLLLSAVAFYFLKPVFVSFMRSEDFERRRNLWYVLTAAAFVSPNFWVYVAVVSPFILYAFARDNNPVALFALCVFTLPPIEIAIPFVGGINQLFPLSHFRLLVLIGLLPALLKTFALRTNGVEWRPRGLDLLIISFVLLQYILIIPYTSATNSFRILFLLVLDIVILYFSITRLVFSKARLVEMLGCFCLAVVVMVPMAIFEFGKSWLLFESIGYEWGAPNVFAYLMRGSSLRAQVSAGHSIALGYLMAMALGCWLFLRTEDRLRDRHKFRSAIILIALITGLLVALARGPWIGAFAIVVMFAVLAVRRQKSILALLAGGAVVMAVVALSPLGTVVVEYIPFVGKIDNENVLYRQRLFFVSIEIIKQNLWFGDPLFIYKMEELRQGQGIVDLVNAYVTVALQTGLVGLVLFAIITVFPAYSVFRTMRNQRLISRSNYLLGVALFAALVASALMSATFGLGGVFDIIRWMFVGFCINYSRCTQWGIATPRNVPMRPLNTFVRI